MGGLSAYTYLIIMCSLLEFSASIEDFRLNRKKLHPVENIVFITLVALFSDAITWEDVEDFGESKFSFFEKYLDLSNGIPSHDTFNRFFSLYAPDKFSLVFIDWLKKLLDSSVETNHIAIDGKTLRGSGNSNKSMIHMLHAYLTESHCLIGQLKTSDKSNEITAIPELLDLIDIENKIVSIDAMGCQKDIAEKIVLKKGDYFLAVKGNQKTLYEDIVSAMAVTPLDNYGFSK
jgi:hypothetical protein